MERTQVVAPMVTAWLDLFVPAVRHSAEKGLMELRSAAVVALEPEEIGMPDWQSDDFAFATAELEAGVDAPVESVEIRLRHSVEVVPDLLETVLRPATDLDRSPGMKSFVGASVQEAEGRHSPQKRLVGRLHQDCNSD